MRTIPIAELQADAEAALDKAQKERLVIVRNGKPSAVVVGIEGYDAEDLQLASSPEFWRMIEERRYGRIINIGSEVFERGLPEFSSYVSAKGAQLGLTRSWALELAATGITVNQISPGWIPTERHADDPQEMKDAYAATVPMRHMGVPEDVGEAVAFLASDGAKFITGQKLAVNGGNTLA